MVDAVDVASVDVVGFLEGQDAQIKSLFLATLANCGSERTQAFYELRRLLAVHEAAETEIIDPQAEQMLANSSQAVQRRHAEERHTTSMMSELEELNVNTDDFVYRLNELRKAIADRANRDHQELTELWQESMADDLHRMARAIELGGSTAPGELAGSFSTMTERARNIINGR